MTRSNRLLAVVAVGLATFPPALGAGTQPAVNDPAGATLLTAGQVYSAERAAGYFEILQVTNERDAEHDYLFVIQYQHQLESRGAYGAIDFISEVWTRYPDAPLEVDWNPGVNSFGDDGIELSVSLPASVTVSWNHEFATYWTIRDRGAYSEPSDYWAATWHHENGDPDWVWGCNACEWDKMSFVSLWRVCEGCYTAVGVYSSIYWADVGFWKEWDYQGPGDGFQIVYLNLAECAGCPSGPLVPHIFGFTVAPPPPVGPWE